MHFVCGSPLLDVEALTIHSITGRCARKEAAGSFAAKRGRYRF